MANPIKYFGAGNTPYFMSLIKSWVTSNFIKGIKINGGDALTPDVNKVVDITVPTQAEKVEKNINGYTSADQVVEYVSKQMAGAGLGDMLKATYDTNDDGIVDAAENATKLNNKEASYYENKIEKITVNGEEITISDKTAAITITGIDFIILDKDSSKDIYYTRADDGKITITGTGKKGIFYLIPETEGAQTYIEYAYINNAWEKIGTTDVDLSGYVKTSDLTEFTETEIKNMWDAAADNLTL